MKSGLAWGFYMIILIILERTEKILPAIIFNAV